MKTSCDFPSQFICPIRWDTLHRCYSSGSRYCGVCEKRVHTVTTREEFQSHALLGDCVAIFLPDHGESLTPIWFGQGRIIDYQKSGNLQLSPDDEL